MAWAITAAVRRALFWTRACNGCSPIRIVPKMQFGTAQTFFNDVQAKFRQIRRCGITKLPPGAIRNYPRLPRDEVTIPTWKDELYLEFHRGVFTTQSNHKRNMREAEEEILNAEKYASLAWLDGRPYPAAELNDAWKKVLFNQFHDLAAGSGIGVIYKDAQQDYDQVRWATKEVTSKSLDTLEAQSIREHADVSGSVPLMIVNPLGWQRSGLVEADVQMPARRHRACLFSIRKGRFCLQRSSPATTRPIHITC